MNGDRLELSGLNSFAATTPVRISRDLVSAHPDRGTERLARAHANCVESLPVFSGLLIVALLTNRAGVTNPLAPWLFAARLVQSGAHLASLSVPPVWVRFIAFAVQMAIAVYMGVVLELAVRGSEATFRHGPKGIPAQRGNVRFRPIATFRTKAAISVAFGATA